MNDNIIELSSKTHLKLKRKKGFCRCNLVYVVEKYRILECRECGATIDPFDFVYKCAVVDTGLLNDRERIRKEIKKLHPKLEALKKEERNIKARIKRAKEKLNEMQS